MGVLFWIILLVIFLILEAITYGLVSIWFAAGALVSAVLSLFIDDLAWVEWAVFAVVSALTLYFLRPYMVDSLKDLRFRNRTGILTYVGQKAKVIEDIDNLSENGRVDYKGQSWAARSVDDNKKISKDAVVVIRDIKGVKMIVEEVKEVVS